MVDKRPKIVFLGDGDAGKSTIFNRLRHGYLNKQQTTIGSDFITYFVNKHKVYLWDTAGQERYFAITPMYTRGSTVVILVYDMSDQYSLQTTIDKWIPYIKSNVNTTETKVILVGNKCDLAIPSYKDGIDVPSIVDSYITISAKTGKNCKKLMKQITKYLPSEKPNEKNIQNANSSTSVNLYDRLNVSRRSCCMGIM